MNLVIFQQLRTTTTPTTTTLITTTNSGNQSMCEREGPGRPDREALSIWPDCSDTRRSESICDK